MKLKILACCLFVTLAAGGLDAANNAIVKPLPDKGNKAIVHPKPDPHPNPAIFNKRPEQLAKQKNAAP